MDFFVFLKAFGFGCMVGSTAGLGFGGYLLSHIYATSPRGYRSCRAECGLRGSTEPVDLHP